MTPQQLEDWLYACLPSRPTLEKAATSRVTGWSWAKGGLWQPHEAGLAKERRSYSNVFGFPQKLTPASIRAHQQTATAVRLHYQYVWKRGLLARIEVELHGGKGWGIERGFEHDAKGKLTSVWRPRGTAKEVLWP